MSSYFSVQNTHIALTACGFEPTIIGFTCGIADGLIYLFEGKLKNTALFKVKEGKLDQWKQWCFLLTTARNKEATDSLCGENALEEEWILFSVGADHYVYASTSYFDTPLPSDKTLAINQEHIQQRQDCLECVARGETLCHIQSPTVRK